MATNIRGLGAVQPHVKRVAEEIAGRFGVTNIGGFATSGHITNSDHYKGLALDVMTSEKGEMVAQWAVTNAARLGVTYIIWNRRIYDTRNKRGWERYTGTSPHTDHVHISFHASGGDGSAPVESNTTNIAASGCLGWLVGK